MNLDLLHQPRQEYPDKYTMKRNKIIGTLLMVAGASVFTSSPLVYEKIGTIPFEGGFVVALVLAYIAVGLIAWGVQKYQD